jgi:branched-chain amino acid aminotransferase
MARIIEFLNGKRIHPGSSFLNGENRSFLFGDGVFETVRIMNGKPLFWNDHLERLLFGMDRLILEQPSDDFEQFISESVPAIITNENIRDARMRITIFRDSTGLYTPDELSSSWYLTIKDGSSLNLDAAADLKAIVFSDMHKENSLVSRVKTTSSLLYVMAGIHANMNGAHESIILNPEGRIVESHTSNLFILKNDVFQTPPISEGCIDGVMRRQLIGIMNRNGLELREQPITKADLIHAEELLLSNVMSWVRNVHCFSDKNYQTEWAAKLNAMILESVSG